MTSGQSARPGRRGCPHPRRRPVRASGGNSAPTSAARREDDPRGKGVRLFLTTVPGIAPLAGRMIEQLGGAAVQHVGFDGRSDVVVEVDKASDDVLALPVAEDVFAEVGRTLDLRRTLTQVIGKHKPRWRVEDPAQVEVWITEYQQGRFVAGLRLSDARMSQHEGRSVERQGALRPTVAAAMVGLAGTASGSLLDPCCGSGTILAEARAAGWEALGVDIDSDAVDIAATNVPTADVQVGDARRLEAEDSSIGACVSNLPFGQQFAVEGEMSAWLGAVLREMERVTVPGGRIVLLAPSIPRSVVPGGLQFMERHMIRLLGTKTSIWMYTKKDSHA